MSDTRARKSVTAVEIKDADKGEITGLFSRFGVVDHDGDWTEPGAFEDGAKVRISAYGHGSWGSGTNALPVGKGVIRLTSAGAILEGQFFMNTEHGKATFETVKALGDLQELSYGYDVIATGDLTDELRQKGARRVLAKLKVHEVSPVLLGAGIGTGVLAVKAADAEKMRESALTELARFEKTRARLHGALKDDGAAGDTAVAADTLMDALAAWAVSEAEATPDETALAEAALEALEALDPAAADQVEALLAPEGAGA